MKNNTKHKILETSRKLFNEKGYNQVSIKDIADVLGISKGNLTYHFKKKEDIMEALLGVDKDPSEIPAPETYDELIYFFEHMQQVVEENAFYFLHHAQLSQLSDRIDYKQREMYKINSGRLLSCFKTLNEGGIFRNEAFEGEYQTIIDALLISCIYWLPFCKLKGLKIKDPKEKPLRYTDHAEDMIRHLLK